MPRSPADGLFGSLQEQLAFPGADPERPAVVTHHRTLTYRALSAAARSVGASLSAAGLERGDRVVIYTGNTWECAVAIYGTLCAGGVFVVVNDQVKSEKLSAILADCEPAAMVVDASLAGRAAPALSSRQGARVILVSGPDSKNANDRSDGAAAKLASGVNCPVVHFATALGESFDGGAETSRDTAPLASVNPLDLAALIYTSGSTGEPKGVMMTHQAMRFASESIATYLRLANQDTIINFLPLSFDYGLYQLLMAVNVGATLVLESSFVYPSTIVNAVNNNGVTVFPGVPTVYSMLVSLHRKTGLTLPTVRTITNTAAALSDDLIPDLRAIFPNARVYKMYGLTECKRVSYLEPDELDAKPGSVGTAIPGTEVFLRGRDGEAIATGEPGILHVRGPHVMLGYWNKPERTAEMLVPGRYPYERVLRTGDWFRMDEDGYLYFEGRSDDIIKSRGEKVSPLEVERVIRRLPAVQEALVFGMDDEVLGQAVGAVVEPRPGEELSERQIKAHCARYLEGFMVPKRVKIVGSMPKNPNGKLDRRKLAAMLSE